jgi:hypothetical protein
MFSEAQRYSITPGDLNKKPNGREKKYFCSHFIMSVPTWIMIRTQEVRYLRYTEVYIRIRK